MTPSTPNSNRWVLNASILVVDDQQANVELLEALLTNLGYTHIHKAYGGQEALDFISKQVPDLILLDLMMPEINGLDILDKLKHIPAFQQGLIKVMVLTADVTDSSREKSLSLGAHDFLTKPFDFVEVSLRIKNLLYSLYLLHEVNDANQRLEELVEQRTEELHKTNEILFRQNDILRDIAWTQSHIVRAPVSRILGLMDLLDYAETTDDETRTLLGHIKTSIVELDQIIREIAEKTESTENGIRKNDEG